VICKCLDHNIVMSEELRLVLVAGLIGLIGSLIGSVAGPAVSHLLASRRLRPRFSVTKYWQSESDTRLRVDSRLGYAVYILPSECVNVKVTGGYETEIQQTYSESLHGTLSVLLMTDAPVVVTAMSLESITCNEIRIDELQNIMLMGDMGGGGGAEIVTTTTVNPISLANGMVRHEIMWSRHQIFADGSLEIKIPLSFEKSGVWRLDVRVSCRANNGTGVVTAVEPFVVGSLYADVVSLCAIPSNRISIRSCTERG
jgi:hypothetical protein